MPKAGKWVQNVKTTSTYPPKGLFTKDAETIALVMSSKEVSPKGIGSAVRMVQFFINRSEKLVRGQKGRAGKGKRNPKRKAETGKGALRKRYFSRRFCRSLMADHAAKALVFGLSGCGSFANRRNISPNRHFTWNSCVLRCTVGSETTCTRTLAGLTVNARVAATFISRG